MQDFVPVYRVSLLRGWLWRCSCTAAVFEVTRECDHHSALRVQDIFLVGNWTRTKESLFCVGPLENGLPLFGFSITCSIRSVPHLTGETKCLMRFLARVYVMGLALVNQASSLVQSHRGQCGGCPGNTASRQDLIDRAFRLRPWGQVFGSVG